MKKPIQQDEESMDTSTNNEGDQASPDSKDEASDSSDNDIHQRMSEFVDNLSPEEFSELQNCIQYRLDEEEGESNDEESSEDAASPKSKSKASPKSSKQDFDMFEMMGGNDEESDKMSVTTA